ncbi:MAG: hypothetical protein IJ437_05880 [Clostridia bacterium]|nr:hypothetical protein [Clostridia bacterium]
MGIAALVLGILAFFLNPCYICSLLSIILGAVGMRGPYRTMGMVGMILGIVSLVAQFAFDILTTIFSFGVGAFTFCL